MMLVKIYVYQTIKGPGTKSGSYTYILETEIKGKTATLSKTDILEPMTENKAELTILLEALKRLRASCDVEIIGTSEYVKQGFENWIDGWIESDWKNARGKDVANKEQWQQLAEYMKNYSIAISTEKDHAYSQWMQKETDKKETERINTPQEG